MATERDKMRLLVSKWGNSLAVRLPAESAKQIGVGGGGTLTAEISPDGNLVLAREGRTLAAASSPRARADSDGNENA
jgi:antitoxin MazE